jgi:hypothetical protein
MSKLLTFSLVSALSLTTFLIPASSQAANLSVVTKSQGSPTTPVVVEVSGVPVVANPFDRQLIRVVATIKQPDGSTFATDGFWYQEYKLQNINGQRSTMKVGDPNWRFTFSSTIAGTYTSTVEVLVSGQKVVQESHSITTNYQTIPKVKVDGVSFVRGNAPFVPIAYNIAWANRFEEVDKYEQWFSQASKAGVNVARVWMASWSLAIEWTDTGLGDYSKRLDRAWLLDQVFLIAAKYNIGINLVLINHGAFSTSTNPEWYSNPYNSSNGGPISNPGEFATNEIAWKFWEQRLRYIVARYAAYPSLFTWEWWNEVNFTPISSNDLKAWSIKSNAVLDQADPYRTLRTSSWSSAASLQDWSIFDYAVTHVYDASDPIKSLTVQADALRAAVPNKPILVGEMGSGTVTEDPFADPRGLHLHNSQWAATFVGFAGPASYWWWDIYVDPLNLWPITTGLNKLISGANVAAMKPSRISGFPASSVLTLSSDKSVLGWIRHNNFDRSAKTQLLLDAAITALKTKKPIKTVFPDPVSKGGNLKVPVSKPGKYNVSFIHTFTGASIGKQVATTPNQLLSIKVPKFTGDLAFRIEAVLP